MSIFAKRGGFSDVRQVEESTTLLHLDHLMEVSDSSDLKVGLCLPSAR